VSEYSVSILRWLSVKQIDGCMGLVQAELGRQLAEMHKAGSSEKGFGFAVDNTIGRSHYSHSLKPHF
jgi:fructosamine-3-kinase